MTPEPILAGSCLQADDLVNLGLNCSLCHSAGVVYLITKPNPGFPRGVYCYKCLLNLCRSTKRIKQFSSQDEYMIPTPMPWLLLSRLKADLGLEKPQLSPY